MINVIRIRSMLCIRETSSKNETLYSQQRKKKSNLSNMKLVVIVTLVIAVVGRVDVVAQNVECLCQLPICEYFSVSCPIGQTVCYQYGPPPCKCPKCGCCPFNCARANCTQFCFDDCSNSCPPDYEPCEMYSALLNQPVPNLSDLREDGSTICHCPVCVCCPICPESLNCATICDEICERSCLGEGINNEDCRSQRTCNCPICECPVNI